MRVKLLLERPQRFVRNSYVFTNKLTVQLCLILRDQFNHKAWIVPSVNLQVKIINDGSDSNESRKIEHGSPLWEAGLKSLQEVLNLEKSTSLFPQILGRDL